MIDFDAKKNQLADQLAAAGGNLKLAKRTSSNLFRYTPRAEARRRIDLSCFNRVLGVDREKRTLEVEGLATFESVVDHTLPHGLAPLITPELKHITVGGAAAGIGIESNCFRHGFVHDGLIEADALLPDGRIVTCTGGNEYADLFRALPNSYGTLGYILRAKMRLMPAGPYVHLHSRPFDSLEAFLDAMQAATGRADVDFVEGLFYSDKRLLLTLSRFVDAPPRVDEIVRRNVFYKLIEQRQDVYLATKDYLFRYDPEWFWNLPEGRPYQLFRRFAPMSMRNSGFYRRYINWKHLIRDRLHLSRDDGEEPLIQDWEVSWDNALEFSRFALRETDLSCKPWFATPIRTAVSPTIYPIRANILYFNLGSYSHVKKVPGRGDYYYTRILDRKCIELGGIKMLYSTTFLSEAEFNSIYNGEVYARLKAKYDPHGRLRTLFEKCAGTG